MKQRFFLLLLLFSFFGVLSARDYTRYVNVFAGTGGHGHTFPGATLPFGMVQLSPDQRTQGWDWCSGYHYSDTTIKGFSHTHLSGTGASDLGDILIMPYTGPITFTDGGLHHPEKGYRSSFSHDDEFAEPGYYRVLLKDDQILAELTATLRCGFHRYSFPSGKKAHVIIDLEHGISDSPVETYLKIIDSVTVAGYRRSSGWARDHTIYFYARFSRAFSDWITAEGQSETGKVTEHQGKLSKIVLSFGVSDSTPLLIKVGISAVDMDGARKNLEAELPHWDFDKIRREAKQAWNRMLSRIQIQNSDRNALIKFYTSLYHALIHPSLFSDADGRYLGMDGHVHQSDDPYYTIFSLWDTFRATHPFYQFVYPEYNEAFVKTMLKKYREFGQLPMWELHSNETYCMTGNHSLPVLAEYILYGNTDESTRNLAAEAAIRTSFLNERDMDDYRRYGFVPSDAGSDAVTKTLEYAYDDYCVARILETARDYSTATWFLNRSLSYRNLFDSETGFFRGKNRTGLWVSPFDPIKPSGWGTSDYTEGNAWQYLWFVPHNIPDIIPMLGGREAFAGKLDQFFRTHFSDHYYIPSDISGLIGMYAHGNEPVHHVLYLYNFAGKPEKTQKLVRHVLDSLYSAKVDAYPGNEDCGQMSSWFLFSSLGFYPVDPVSPYYVIGSPLFDEVRLSLPKGKQLIIKVHRKHQSDTFIRKVKWNGRDYPYYFLDKTEIWKGGTLEFFMTAAPEGNWGKDVQYPEAILPDKQASIQFVEPVYMPYEDSQFFSFLNEKNIRFRCNTQGASIIYATTENFSDAREYSQPITINKSATFWVKAVLNGRESDVARFHFQREICKLHSDQPFPRWLKKPVYSPKYAAGGDDALFDGIFGSEKFTDGKWQGLQGNHLDVIIDLGKAFHLDSITIRFLKNHASWIFLPEKVVIYAGTNPEHLFKLYEQNFSIPEGYEPDEIRRVTCNLSDGKYRYIRVYAENMGTCPAWHSGAGHKAWMFVDEISVVPADGEKVGW